MDKVQRLALSLCTAVLLLGSFFSQSHGGAALVADVPVCAGDCDESGQVTVDEVLTLVNAALGNALAAACDPGDIDHNSRITVDEILSAVNNTLNGCALSLTATPSATPTATQTPSQGSAIAIRDAVARDSQGQAIRSGQTVTTEGIVTVAAGLLANNRLKIFAQESGAGILVYAPSAASMPAFQVGDRLRVTGVVGQLDTTEGVQNGTVFVDISVGSWAVLSSGNALPSPQAVQLTDIVTGGPPYVGTLVSLTDVGKMAGSWPVLGSKSTSVTVSDDGGTSQLPLRFQKNTISPALVNELSSIASGPFNLVGIVVQNAPSTNDLLTGFEIWVRGAEDVAR